MNAAEYDRMFQLEDQYWWFVGRRRLALNLISKYNLKPDPELLDLGCGTGVILNELNKIGPSTGLDMSDAALSYCKQRGLERLVRARGEWLPVRSETIDGIVALDVFEHIEDDKAAFRETFRTLRPGGILVLSVPAFKSLWGPHDVALHHFRRYRRNEVGKKLLEAGFIIETISYGVFFLFPITLAIRAAEKLKKSPPEASLPAVPSWLNKALIGLQTFEANMIRALPLPWGSSVVAVARKPMEGEIPSLVAETVITEDLALEGA